MSNKRLQRAGRSTRFDCRSDCSGRQHMVRKRVDAGRQNHSERALKGVTGKAFNYIGAVSLQLMLAQQADLSPGEFVWVGGDVHLYLNHLEQAREQLAREPRPFPTMRLTRRAESIDDYRIGDFEVNGYEPHDAIKADVAV